MPLAHLLGALERDATAQAAALTEDANARAAAVQAASDGRVARRREDVLAARRVELVAAMEVALAETRRVARRAALDARARLLDRIFDAARGLFPAAVGESVYRNALAAELVTALRAVGDEPAVVRCAKSLMPMIRGALPGKSTVTVRADPSVGPGFRVAAADGVLEVDATLDGRLERLRPALSLALMRALEPSA